jgi:hypothetical protein
VKRPAGSAPQAAAFSRQDTMIVCVPAGVVGKDSVPVLAVNVPTTTPLAVTWWPVRCRSVTGD